MRDRFALLRGKYYTLKYKILKSNIAIQNGLKAYRRLEIRGPGAVKIGRNCTVDGLIGDSSQYVTIYTHSPNASVTIGNDVCLHAAKLGCKFAIVIGDAVLIEEASIIDTDFHSIDKNRDSILGEEIEKCRIVIGDRVSIGSRCTIMKGVRIGDDSIIGPGAVVNRSLPARSFALGNPAKVMVDMMYRLTK